MTDENPKPVLQINIKNMRATTDKIVSNKIFTTKVNDRG